MGRSKCQCLLTRGLCPYHFKLEKENQEKIFSVLYTTTQNTLVGGYMKQDHML